MRIFKRRVNGKEKTYCDLGKKDSALRKTLHLVERNAHRVQRRFERFCQKKRVRDAFIHEPRRSLVSVKALKVIIQHSDLVTLKAPDGQLTEKTPDDSKKVEGGGDGDGAAGDPDSDDEDVSQLDDEEKRILEGGGHFFYPTFDADNLMVYSDGEETESEKLKAFTSYRSTDGKNVALDTHYCLRAEKVDAFLDEKKLHGGIENNVLLEGKIRDAHMLFFVLSPQTESAKWQGWELDIFMDAKKRNPDKVVVPIHHQIDHDRAPEWYKQHVKKDVKFISTASESFYDEIREAIASFMDVLRI